MRTNALILTAALGIASAASSMAQAVYSVNVVGYINLAIQPGFNLVANQLKASPNNSLGSVMPLVATETQVLKFVNNNYTADIFDGSGWLDNSTGEPSTTTVAPGEGFFLYSPGAATVTLVGEVTTGNNLPVNMGAGFTLISSIVPQTIALDPSNGFNDVAEMQYLTFNAGTQNYNTTLVNDGSGWLNNETGDPVPDPTPAVGQGFFIYSTAPATWLRSFNPNN
jgi:hypothetical protein